jgi:WD40 repeat protein
VYHEGFIYAVLASADSNGFFSASKDKKIYHIDSFGNPSILFEGHEGAVNSLSQAIPEELVSGSWDGTARVWDTKTGECKYVLEGHSHAVSVLVLPNGIIITGS